MGSKSVSWRLESVLVIVAALLAVRNPARARIVHNPGNVPVTINALNPSATIDIANDAGAWDDFALQGFWLPDLSWAYVGPPDDGCHVRPAVTDTSNDNVMRLDENDPIEYPLWYNTPIDSIATFFMCSSFGPRGEFVDQTGYVGLLLIDGGTFYYGWALVETGNCNTPDAYLTVVDWAYQNIADRPILAGDTGQSNPDPCPSSFCNPSMEDAFVSGIARYWDGWGDGSFEEETYYAHEGSKSQEISWFRGPGEDTFGPTGIYQQITGLQQGQIYQVSGWFKCRFEAHHPAGWESSHFSVSLGVNPTGGADPASVTDWHTETYDSGGAGPWLNIMTVFSPDDANSTLFIRASGHGDAQSEDWECPSPPCIGPSYWEAYWYIDDVGVQPIQSISPDSSVLATTTSIPANGASLAEVTLVVVDTDGAPIEGIPPWEIDVNCTGSGNVLMGPDRSTDENGQTTVRVASSVAGNKTVTVSVFGTELPEKPVINFCESDLDKLRASDGASEDFFGESVAIAGDTAVVGAPRDDDNGTNSGATYVFRYNGSLWVQEAKLLATDGASEDLFGESVAMDTDIAIVGAYKADDNGNESGAVYVFRYEGSTWTQEAKLLASDGVSNDLFGISVGIDTDTVVVGAPGDDDKGFNSGSAYVFRYDGSTWVQDAKLLASDGSADDFFGEAIGIDTNVVIVGAADDGDNGFDSGSAYVFRYDGSHWGQDAKLLASDGAQFDSFGGSVDIDTDIAIVGATGDDDNDTSSGSAYVFRHDGSGWGQEAKLLAFDGGQYDSFGRSVALAGDIAIVGAPKHRDNWFEGQTGSAYVFRHDGSGWTMQDKLRTSDREWGDGVGSSVAIDTKNAIVGAPDDDDSGNRSGSVYIFPAFLPGDLDRDGDVDTIDLAGFVGQWLGNPHSPSADIAPCGGDCKINTVDFGAFADNWLFGAE